MLEAKKISYRYGQEQWLFKELDLNVKRGEIVGLFGYSGSGKTTMAQIPAGYLMSPEGTVTIDKKPIPKSGVHPVQLVWQHPEKSINPKWRMKEVLAEVDEIDTELLKTLGIKQEWLHRWPSELSGGNYNVFVLLGLLVKTQNI